MSFRRDQFRTLVFAAGLLATGAASGAWAQETAEPPTQDATAEETATEKVERRVLGLPIPDLPLWGEAARKRGVVLPPTYGVGLIAVQDQQGVFGDRLKVSVAKGDPPPPDAVLISVPAVSFDNVGSTDSLQVKGDVWVAPFLNLFASAGKVKGDIAIDVIIDVDALLGPPLCRPSDPCGIKHLYFNSPLDNTIVTVGATGAYGGERWFVAATLSRTVSIADKDRSDVATTNFGIRGGPRLFFGRFRIDPYVGVNWLDLDTRVKGTTGLPNAFPDGDDLSVRYDAHVKNVDEYSLALGANAGINQHWALQAEYGYAPSGDRIILSATYRF